MNATQPERAIASDETLQPVLAGWEIKCLELEGLEVEGLDVEILAIKKTDRWSIYHRLQELGIPCNCAIEKPLKAQIGTPTAALQLWSVAHRYRASRSQLLDLLEDCWQAKLDS